jgi:hypothetical protein
MDTPLGTRRGFPAPDLIDRDFSATASNERWMADITEFSTDEAVSISPGCSTCSAAGSWPGPWDRAATPSSSSTP